MQIILLILQLISIIAIVALAITLNQYKQRIRNMMYNISRIKRDVSSLDNSLSMFDGEGTYAIVRQWHDTHNCTVEYVVADYFEQALDCSEDKEGSVIVNIYKVS